MDAKEAATAAKKHLAEILSDEAIAPPTLEEIWFESSEQVWYVTLGVRRLTEADTAGSVANRLGLSRIPDYKVVRISDKDGSALSIRDRLSQMFAK